MLAKFVERNKWQIMATQGKIYAGQQDIGAAAASHLFRKDPLGLGVGREVADMSEYIFGILYLIIFYRIVKEIK